MNRHISIIFAAMLLAPLATLHAAEYHVALTGSDANPGTPAAPLRTIQRAADLAQPGDTVTVHAGVYRERVNPPRGGESDNKRIVYQAAPGEQVVVTGAEAMKGWEKVVEDTWKIVIPNTFFNGFNPFSDRIQGEWCDPTGRHAGMVYLNGDWFAESLSLDPVLKPATKEALWFAQVDRTGTDAGQSAVPGGNTTLWAQFRGVNPNNANVEINKRQSVFYPSKSGINYITVRGFTMRQAATPWAGAMSEQIGLVGTHWSKGWIIENNDISYSMCTGVTLGRYELPKDEFPPVSAPGFVTSIELALRDGWSKEKIGSHIVRNNRISHCEKNAIHGSLGAPFSEISGNEIHDIAVRNWVQGADTAGIKFLGPIDTTISGNHIYRTCRGIWLDWMTQGARISNNLCHDNATHDLFVEVSHGPFVVDNNIFLSPKAIEDDSQGGAYAYNLIAGGIDLNPTFHDGRKTPFHKPHSTEVVSLHDNPSGDSHYYNNLFMRSGSLEKYDQAHLPMWMDGNVFFQGAKSSKHESTPINRSASDPGLTLVEKNDGFYLTMTLDTALGSERPSRPVTSARLGKARISGCAFENPDGSPITIGTDYFGKPRNTANPTPGPFEAPGTGTLTMKVWPPTVAGAQAAESGTDKDGLVPLFDGKTLNGWQTTGNWIVEEGGVVALHPRPGESGWQRYDAYLTTARKYKDFILDLEFKLEKEGNSGVFLRVGDRMSQVNTGFEIQILDTHGLAKPGNHDCGGLIGAAAPSKNMAKPAGQWNRYVITLQGKRLKVEMNGEQIHDLELDKSAVKDRPSEGYIGFQDEGLPVWYRNVRIKELK